MSNPNYPKETYGRPSAVYGGITYNATPWYLSSTLFVIQVDWDGDGLFNSGENEYSRVIPGGVTIERGREHLVKPSGEGFESMRAGKMTVFLLNEDGRYNPRNDASPLFPMVKSGRKISFWYQGEINLHEDVFSGYLTNITPMKKDGVNVVKLEAEDGWSYLEKTPCSVALMEGARADAIINAILNNTGYPWGRDLEAGADVIGYYYATNKKAAKEINGLAESELGFAFIAKNGDFRFKNRYSNFLQYSILTPDFIAAPPLLRQPWEAIRNSIRITANPRTLRASAVLFALPAGQLLLGIGQSVTLWMDYKYNGVAVPAKSVITPVAVTDFTANSMDDGSGTDLTALIKRSFTAFGESAKIVLTNEGSSAAYITKLQVRGSPVEALTPVSVVEESGAGDLRFTLNLPWQQDINRAVDFADNLLKLLSVDNYFPVVEYDTDVETLAFYFELGDLINVDLGSIEGDYRVCKLSHELRERRVWRTVVWLEPVLILQEDVWKFSTTIGVLSKFYF